MAEDRMSAEDFQRQIREGGLIPSKRGVVTSKSQDAWKTKEKKRIGRPPVTDRPLKTNAPNPNGVVKTVKKVSGNKGVPAVSAIPDPIIKKEQEYWEKQGGLYIPFEVISLKNSKVVYPYIDLNERPRMMVQPSNAYAKYQRFTAFFYKKGLSWWRNNTKGMEKPILVGYYLLRKTKGKFDFHNMIHGPLDIMVAGGYMKDDDKTKVAAFPMGTVVSRNAPGIVLFILKPEDVPFWRGVSDEERIVSL